MCSVPEGVNEPIESGSFSLRVLIELEIKNVSMSKSFVICVIEPSA